MAKRGTDALVSFQDPKRSRNELVAIANRDKALIEAVSKASNTTKSAFFVQLKYVFVGCETHIKPFFADYAVGRPRRGSVFM